MIGSYSLVQPKKVHTSRSVKGAQQFLFAYK